MDDRGVGAPLALGIYHLDQVDATNLEIRDNGAFQWTIEGCDFGGGQCGAWTEQNGKLVFSGKRAPSRSAAARQLTPSVPVTLEIKPSLRPGGLFVLGFIQ